MLLFDAKAPEELFGSAGSEDEYLRWIQLQKLQSYSLIAEILLPICGTVAGLFYGEHAEILAASMYFTAIVSFAVRKGLRRSKWVKINIHLATFMLSTLYLVTAAISTMLRPEDERGRAMVLVGLASSTYCISTRWLIAHYIAMLLLSNFAWHYGHQSFGSDELVIFGLATPVVGVVIHYAQQETLKSAYRFQREARQRQVELESALQRVTIETERRLEVEEQRRAGEQKLNEQQAQLLHVSRLSTMGELVAGIAHEVHQPLHALGMHAGVIDALTRNASGDSDAKLRESAEKITKLVELSSETIRRLQNFVRRGPRSCVTVPMTQIIDDALALTGVPLKNLHVKVTVQRFADDCRVHVDPIQIQQVLVNLLRNSIEAMQNTPVEQRAINLKIDCDGKDVTLSVCDTGHGLSVEQASRVFDTFYSTKPDGLGIGLAISRSIVEDHAGTIEVQPATKWAEEVTAGTEATHPGACFVIRLPGATGTPAD